MKNPRHTLYKLDGHKPVPCTFVHEWGLWFEKADRTVAKTQIGDVEVSTVFLGINHHFGSGKPILFETMVFGGIRDGETRRYHTWDEAEQGHAAMVRKVSDA